jgi:hypothetical protein
MNLMTDVNLRPYQHNTFIADPATLELVLARLTQCVTLEEFRLVRSELAAECGNDEQQRHDNTSVQLHRLVAHLQERIVEWHYEAGGTDKDERVLVNRLKALGVVLPTDLRSTDPE